ncbi:MAG TPA: choice-of-anchor P family protein, partial [Candidatus Limnocylindria bacterium]|nr:choice-of-anchor P family protein [Candidatus Limnocylindria bacterium]
VTGEANQTILLPAGAGKIVINEQPVASASAGNGDITVNALHVVITGVADVTVASAHADIACGLAGDCTNKDFVTGGGWITQTPSGARANFAVAGGIKNGAFWGHLTYIDHGNPGMKVKGTGVTAYVVVTGTTSRHIEGTTESGTYSADVADNGEPGHGVDTFVLTLTGGYSAGGLISGGNIQLHCK